MNLTGNTVLITGAGTGMGLEAARRFGKLGNRVVMVARNAERLEAEASRIDGAEAIACDITDEAAVDRLVTRVSNYYPELNMVLLNAGITHAHKLFDSARAFEHAEAEMRTNYLSTVRLIHRFEPFLSRNVNAAFIITTSGVAFAPDIGNPTYSATKAALHSLVQSMRLQLRRNDASVRVVELMAPLVDSGFSAHVVSDRKMAPADVITDLLTGLEQDEEELRVGLSEDIYQEMLRSPEAALLAVNDVTGG